MREHATFIPNIKGSTLLLLLNVVRDMHRIDTLASHNQIVKINKYHNKTFSYSSEACHVCVMCIHGSKWFMLELLFPTKC